MRPPGSGPSAREIETQQQWATATPIVTQARTTALSAQQAADAALQSKAPADIARAKDAKKTLVSQLQEAQASRAGMDTPEDARLAETLASLTENTSDPVLLSTQISAAKTSLDRLLTDIGSPVEGNLIPVKTNILTRTQAPRSAAEGPQDRASVTRYAEGEAPPVKGMGFGAETPKSPQQADYRGRHLSPDKESGAPLHEVNSNGIYPDDVYSPKGLQYYRTATSDAMDRKAFGLIQSMRGKPDATVTIYRAMPTNMEQSAMQINPNDWVTISRDYAKLHGDSVLRGDYKIVSKEVKAKDIYTAGDSWLEWGWSPEKLDDLPPIKGMGFGAGTPKTSEQGGQKVLPPPEQGRVRLFNAGTLDRDPGKYLEPHVSDWVNEVAAGAGDFDDLSEITKPLIYLSDEPAKWLPMIVGRKIGKHPTEVTLDDIRQHGRLNVVDADPEYDTIYKVGDFSSDEKVTRLDGERVKWWETDLYDSEDFRDMPVGPEPNDFISRDAAEISQSLTGNDLVEFMQANGFKDPAAKPPIKGMGAAAPFAAVGGAGLTLAGEDAQNQRTVGKPKTSQSARTVGKAKTN
jgi:hypothetical protein